MARILTRLTICLICKQSPSKTSRHRLTGIRAYPEYGTFESGGPCPASHPVRMPQLFYEVIWETKQFNNKADWPSDGTQPFVWSFGDG